MFSGANAFRGQETHGCQVLRVVVAEAVSSQFQQISREQTVAAPAGSRVLAVMVIFSMIFSIDPFMTPSSNNAVANQFFCALFYAIGLTCHPLYGRDTKSLASVAACVPFV